MADGCRSVASIIDLVWRERPSSRQLLGEAWRAPGLDGCYCEKLAEEVAAYYRPVKCQSARNFSDWDAEVQRKEVQRQRRARWKAETRSALWRAHRPEADTDCVFHPCKLPSTAS